jgi:hypothetical protein
MSDQLNEVLNAHGVSIGLSGDEHDSGTWEWFERVSGEFKGGFWTAEAAYEAAAAFLKATHGIEVPALDED